MVILAKIPGQSVSTAENTRPIVVISHVVKVLEKAIKKKIEGSCPNLLKTEHSLGDSKEVQLRAQHHCTT
jgi:hypothetical protein